MGPVVVGGARGDAENFGCLIKGHADEVTQLDQFSFELALRAFDFVQGVLCARSSTLACSFAARGIKAVAGLMQADLRIAPQAPAKNQLLFLVRDLAGKFLEQL